MIVVWISACSPALDWREVSLQGPDSTISLAMLMPTKPLNEDAIATFPAWLQVAKSSPMLVSKVEEGSRRGLFILSRWVLPVQSNTVHFVQTYQQMWAQRQAEQGLTMTGFDLINKKASSVNLTELFGAIPSLQGALSDYLWVSNSMTENRDSKSPKIVQITRMSLLVYQQSFVWVQASYKGDIPVTKQDLGVWLNSLRTYRKGDYPQ
jgi:hypothetical protein